jgi:pantetheine-phosphate adenylyltransferase
MTATVRAAVYPGTFDPPTNGHLDLIARGSRIFDRLIVAVAINPRKTPIFTAEERVEIFRRHTADLASVEVDSFHGMTVDYVRGKGAAFLLRGLRTVSDFEYEFQMALTNRSFAPEIDTVFVMPSQRYAYLSSSLIRESVALGGAVGEFVPADVEAELRKRLRT